MSFLRTLLVWLAVFVAVYLSAMRLVDPRGTFRTGVFPATALDSRALKMDLYRAYRARGPATGLVLGSSRSWKIEPDQLSQEFGGRFFNFGVPVAKTEELLAVYRWVRANGGAPKVVVVGVDVEAMDGLEQDPLFERNQELQRFAPGADAVSAQGWWRRVLDTVGRYKETLTYRYAADAARSVEVLAVRQLLGRPDYRMDNVVFEADGYLRYRRYELERERGTFDLGRETAACLPQYLDKYSRATRLSPERMGYLEQLVREVGSDGGRAVLWLTPLPPVTQARVLRDTRYRQLLSEARSFLDGMAERTGVRTLDFSEIASFGGTPSGFYDCAHVDESNAHRIVDRFGGRGG